MSIFDKYTKIFTHISSIVVGFLVFLIILVIFFTAGASGVGIVAGVFVAIAAGVASGYGTYTTDWVVRSIVYLYSGPLGLTAYDTIGKTTQTIGQTLTGANELLV